ncbi:hypothetical protein JW926_12755 [Candidatus Sumerlaeota bacterium]|nr:hypothetical protein [Candidatus Sumerlaeota bacterium]
MKKIITIATFYFILSSLMIHGEEIPNLTDPYILLSTDTAQFQFVESICEQLEFPEWRDSPAKGGDGVQKMVEKV